MQQRPRIRAVTARNISIAIAATCIAIGSVGRGEDLPLPQLPTGDGAALAKQMREFAEKVIRVYKESDRATYLDNLFRLQIVAGRYAEASKSLAALRRATVADAAQSAAKNVQDEIFVHAKLIEAADRLTFAEALGRAFRETMSKLDDRVSALVIPTFTIPEAILTTPEEFLRANFDAALAQCKGKSAINEVEALKLLRAYQIYEEFLELAPVVGPLIAEDDERRYFLEQNIRVKTRDGATICAELMRPRNAPEKLATLLEFTIYNYNRPAIRARDMRRNASNGYASVVGFTRGKACSPDQPVPYEHDGADAATLIDWITKQDWSDGRVGMYGGSYSGFTAWAAAKVMPKGLKALMVGAAVAPGVDVPMEGNVVWNFIYPWPFYALNNKTLDDATYNDHPRWRRLDHDWYVSGRAYRDLEKIDGTPNPIFDRWIAHPSYDSYWRNMIPYRDEFARVNIPVLNTAGYYYGGPGAASYYFTQHNQYNRKAEHYLLIGPYDHREAQRGTRNSFGEDTEEISGYKRDPAALISITDLRYEWFDYVFKGAPKPAILQSKVNYEVTGANVWKHAPSFAAMAAKRKRFYLAANERDGSFHLVEKKPEREESIAQTVNLADRSDADAHRPGGAVLDNAVDSINGFVFVSSAFATPVEMSGSFSGQLDFVTNKRDFDFNVALFELTPRGQYMQLAPYWSRASYAENLSKRNLLRPGKRQRIRFTSGRLMSHQFETGGRLVAVLSIIKESGREINYGTGKNVIDETIVDAKEPLRIEWYNDSYIDVPIR